MMSPARVSDEVAATAASSRLDAWRCRWSRFFMRRRRCTRLRRATDDTFAYRQSGSCRRAQESRDAHKHKQKKNKKNKKKHNQRQRRGGFLIEFHQCGDEAVWL